MGPTLPQERQSEQAADHLGGLHSLDHQSSGLGSTSVCGPCRGCWPHGNTGRAQFQPRPYLLHCSAPVGRSPPACPLLGPPVPLRRQTHWKEDLGRKIRWGKRGFRSPSVADVLHKGKFTPRDRHTQRQGCVELGGRPMHVSGNAWCRSGSEGLTDLPQPQGPALPTPESWTASLQTAGADSLKAPQSSVLRHDSP